MRVIDHGPADPRESIALEAALFASAEEDKTAETLRFWESQRTAVVVGSSAVIGKEVHELACHTDQIPVIRRVTGGGAVIIAAGCLNYSLVLSLDARPELRDVRYSYQVILGRIVDELHVAGLEVRGLSDLALYRRKVSGNAQRRGRQALLHHGTFFYNFDFRQIERYIKEPERQPPYREGRPHAAFVANLPCGADPIKEALIRAFCNTSSRSAFTSGAR
jgi:lipoate-protein ligase A